MRDLAARKMLRVPEGFSEFPPGACEQPIHRRFEQQAERRADALAIRLRARDIRYGELNAAANRAARRLLATVGGSAKPVAIMMSQGYESILWTLAILKAGYLYAPLDHRLPAAALSGMIDHLEPCALVADNRHRAAATAFAEGRRIPVMASDTGLDDFAAANLAREVSPAGIAYVFYTSGSTGAPKGVADCHRNVLHNIMRYTNTLGFAPGDILSLVQSPSFSGTVSSLFGALANGAAVAPYNLEGDGLRRLSRWLRETHVSVFHAVPSIFRQLTDPARGFPDLRLVRLEGDRVSPLDIDHFKAQFNADCTLVNGLGATECGLVRQFFINRCTEQDSAAPVPLGYAVPDVTVRIADERGEPLPTGSAGEIVVESRYLAAGYWREPALSAQRFCEFPNGLRRYRTGDLGRMDADTCLVHLGRLDRRLRIAGEFIDRTAVEAALTALHGVAHAAVHDYTNESGSPQLCAYVVAAAGATLTADQLRRALSEKFALASLPKVFKLVDRLPLTKDFKIAYELLPPPGRERPALSSEYAELRDGLEHHLAAIWSDVLEIDRVGLDDSLFDLGADSLLATQIATRIEAQLGRRVSLARLFDLGTIRELAGWLAQP